MQGVVDPIPWDAVFVGSSGTSTSRFLFDGLPQHLHWSGSGIAGEFRHALAWTAPHIIEVCLLHIGQLAHEWHLAPGLVLSATTQRTLPFGKKCLI